MKQLNHLGSGGVLFALLAVVVVLLPPSFGLTPDWTPKTTPHRLASNPFAAWFLVVLLAAGLVLIRRGPPLVQCANAFVFAGILIGLGLASGLFWDPWLFLALMASAVPMQRSAFNTFKSLQLY